MRRNAAPTVVRGLLHPPAGLPLVRVEISATTGATARGLAVLDTGATMSCLDRTVADELGLDSPGVADWHAVSGEARHHARQRRARLRIGDDQRLWELDLIELPNLHRAVEGFHVIALLGWDFLDQCVFASDGPSRTFSLTLPLHPIGASRPTAPRR